MSEFQQVRERELALDRRELAEKLLSGQMSTATTVEGPDSLRTLARNVGLERLPDRVLVLRMQLAEEDVGGIGAAERSSAEEISKQLTLARVAHTIEDRCLSWPNTLATIVAPGEMCIFTTQKSRTSNNERQLLDEIGQALLRTARSQGLMTARIGISTLHSQPAELLRAYHEAVSALDSGRSTLNWFEALPERQQQPTHALAKVLKALQAAEPARLTHPSGSFWLRPLRQGQQRLNCSRRRGLLTWACEHLARELGMIGAGADLVEAAREHAIQLIMGAPNSFAMADAFRAFVEQMRQYMVQLFSQREQKIVRETHRLVRELGPERRPSTTSQIT